MKGDVWDKAGKEIIDKAYDFAKVIKAQPDRDLMVKQVWSMLDTTQEHINRVSKKKVSCGSGCSACCHDRIMAAPIEMEVIKKYIAENGIEYDTLLLERQKKGYDKLKWAEKKCGFLDSEGMCKIYEVRPAVCRNHNSTDDPKLCKVDGEVSHSDVRSIETEAMNVALLIVTEDPHTLDIDKYIIAKQL